MACGVQEVQFKVILCYKGTTVCLNKNKTKNPNKQKSNPENLLLELKNFYKSEVIFCFVLFLNSGYSWKSWLCLLTTNLNYLSFMCDFGYGG